MNDAELSALQAWMASALQHRRAVERDAALVGEARRHVSGNDRLRPEEQLEIYREQFWLRHTGALVEDFEGLGAVVGQGVWERLVEEYLAQKPLSSFSLRDLGAELPAFVAGATWLPRHELCVDMARLEWAYVEIFDAPDAPLLDPTALATLSEESWNHARIELSPALRLVAVTHPVAELRRRIRLKQEFELPARGAQKLAVFRARDLNLYHLVLSDLAFDLLSALGQDQTLLGACEALAARGAEAATELEQNVGTWFGTWAERGLIAAVHTTSKG